MENDRVKNAVAGLIGKKPWDVRLGVGSFLTLEFGKRIEREGQSRHHGEWHLWLYMCNWRLQTSSDVLTGSSDERERMETALNSLGWGSVSRVEIKYPAADLCIQFDSGHELKTFSSASVDERQWILFTPDNGIITMHSNGRYDFGPGDVG